LAGASSKHTRCGTYWDLCGAINDNRPRTTLRSVINADFVAHHCIIDSSQYLDCVPKADTQPNALLSSGDLPAQLWTVIGITLIASTFSDVLIVLAIILGYPELRPWIISIFSVGNLFVIGILSISPHMETKPNEPTQKADAPMPADEGIWDRIQTYMNDKKPYLDPDLTLSRLSRMMGIPVKDLSSTINRATHKH